MTAAPVTGAPQKGQKSMPVIVLTGGGSAGHVTPNLALVPELKKRGYDIHYIGSYDGIEKTLAEQAGLPYTGIATGKLRRYFSLKNLTDPARVLKGANQAARALKKIKPAAVFSKGGFVGAPVVWAAHRMGIPCVIHEADLTPGLANKLCFSSADRVLCNFPETLQYLPEGRSLVSGCPVRAELFTGNKQAGLDFLGFDDAKPLLMVVGGSLGAVAVNEAVWKALPELLKDFNVVHLVGKGKGDENVKADGYRQFEYISRELPDLFAAADLVVSRAGANAIFEFVALKKPNILIPLWTSASRGDQVLNAESFKKHGYSMVLSQEGLTPEILTEAVRTLHADPSSYIAAMSASPQANAISTICDTIEQVIREKNHERPDRKKDPDEM